MKRWVRKLIETSGVHCLRGVRKADVLYWIGLLKPVAVDAELIRLGGDGDGGYLIPNELQGVRRCFSPGVGHTFRFEQELSRLGIEVLMADGTISEPRGLPPNSMFTPRNLGVVNNEQTMTLDAWVETAAAVEDNEFLLQMDIEGAEYGVFANASSEVLERFRILVIEFHYLHYLGLPGVAPMYTGVLEKLRANFSVVHLHPNNGGGVAYPFGIQVPRTLEVTMLRNDHVRQTGREITLPNELDQPCRGDIPEIVLERIWYASPG